MANIESTLQAFFNHYPERPIVVAYSGGVDSQVLLHALAKLSQNGQLTNSLQAVHIHHGLSENADAWQQFTERQCQQLNIPYQWLSVSVVRQGGQGIEAEARTARYQAIAQNSPDNALIVTGHHQDDQCETLLLALKRGAGLQGLAAMKDETIIEQRTVLRPLLSVSKVDIEHAAKLMKLDWVEDESNQDCRYDRNFIRQQLMPLVQSRWSAFAKTTARSVEHLREQAELIEQLALQDLTSCTLEGGQLSIESLLALTDSRFKNAIRYCIQLRQGQMPTTEQMRQLRSQLEASEDKVPQVKLGDLWFRRFQHKLFLTRDFQSVTEWSTTVNWPFTESQQTIHLPDELGELHLSCAEDTRVGSGKCCWDIAVPNNTKEITVGFRHQNPRCQPQYRQHSRPLKKVLQELGIPPWQRQRLPMIFIGQQLAAVVGQFICRPFVPTPKQPKLRIYWRK